MNKQTLFHFTDPEYTIDVTNITLEDIIFCRDKLYNKRIFHYDNMKTRNKMYEIYPEKFTIFMI